MTDWTANRVPSCAGVPWSAPGVAARATTGGWRDKKAHGALRSGGCFSLGFWRVPRRAALPRTVRFAPIFLISQGLLHRSELRHGR